MLLIKWDLNDADYAYNEINIGSLEEQKEIRDILRKFTWWKWNDWTYEAKRIAEWWNWIDEEVIKRILSEEEINKLSLFFFKEPYDETNEDFLWELCWEFIPSDDQWELSHHITEVNVYDLIK